MAGGGLLTVGLCCRAATCYAASILITSVTNNDLHSHGSVIKGRVRGIKMRHALAVMLLLVVGSAQAETIVYSTPEVVTAIGGLDIGGTLYNVDFESGVYSTFGGIEDFWTTQAEAYTAAVAINTVLNGPTRLICAVNNGSAFPLNNCQTLNAQYSVLSDVFFGNAAFSHQALFMDEPQWVILCPSCPSIDGVATAWSVVPIPAAVWLFGSGLGLLGWMKRKRA